MSASTYTLQIDHVTRVEGHGSIRVAVRDGQVEEVKMQIVEANRFFENFVKGMLPHDVPQTVSRICGICCVGHQLAALKAVEAAQGLAPSAQTVLLRKLLNESQFLQSHVLHLFFLAVPDYAGAKSILPLASSQPELVKRALMLKKLANDFTGVLGGRTLHPMSSAMLGWRRLPPLDEIAAIRERLAASVGELEAMVRFVRDTVRIPRYERETEYVSLKHPDEYALYEGEVYSSDTKSGVPVADYRNVTNEFTVPHSTTKWSRWHRDSYMVGALARVNNSFGQLRPEAQQVADELGLEVPCYNPYMNNVAQLVEIVHCTHNSIAMFDQVLGGGLVKEPIDYTPRAGIGSGAVEVPRGLLFHHYGFDHAGRCIEADAVIPTSQNVNNVERDMEAFVPLMIPAMDKDELGLHMEMLLRAYDPCISCSVHMVEIEYRD